MGCEQFFPFWEPDFFEVGQKGLGDQVQGSGAHEYDDAWSDSGYGFGDGFPGDVLFPALDVLEDGVGCGVGVVGFACGFNVGDEDVFGAGQGLSELCGEGSGS